jgi:P63C domain
MHALCKHVSITGAPMNDKAITGKARGGHARAQSLSKSERTNIAKRAARERWRADVPKAVYSGEIHIGDLDIPCCVLEDGTRLLTQFGFLQVIGRSPRPAAGRGSSVEKVAPFLDLDNLKPFVSKELEDSTRPIIFQTSTGTRAFGYKAEILPKVCDVYLAARNANALLSSQSKFAKACEIVVRGLAHVGIVALVDEATGYQKDRARDALSRILEAFVAKELQPWVKTFPGDFYEQMFRLRGLPYPNESIKKPQYFGHLTNDVVYRRLAPGVWLELKKEAERHGKQHGKLHQRLTPDLGHPKLRELLASVTTIMKLSGEWGDFKDKLDRIHPAFNETMMLPLEIQEDSGKGI